MQLRVILFFVLGVLSPPDEILGVPDSNQAKLTEQSLVAELEAIKKAFTLGKMDSASSLLSEFNLNHQKHIQSSLELKAAYLSTEATAEYERGHYNSALSKYKSAHKVYQSLSGNKNRPELLELRNDIGRVLIDLNRFEDAKSNYSETLKALKLYKPSEIDSVELSILYNQMGVVEFYEGNLDKAFEFYDNSRTISVMHEGRNNVNAARAYYNMGLIKEEKGYLIDAGIFYNKALQIYQERLGEAHHHIAEVYGSLGSVHLKRYELVKAQYYFQKDLETSMQIYGEGHIETAWGYEDLAKVYKIEGKKNLAKKFFKKALEIRKNSYNEQHIYISNLLLELADFETHIDSSISLAKEAMKMQNLITPNANIGKWEISTYLLDKYIEGGNYEKAEQELIRAINIGNKYVQDKSHYLYAQTYMLGSKLAWSKLDYERADILIQKAINACLKVKVSKKERAKILPAQILFIPEYLEAIAMKANHIYDYGIENERLDLIKGSVNELTNVVEVIKFHQKRRTSDDIEKKYDATYKHIYEVGLKSSIAVWKQTNEKKYLETAFDFAERIKYEGALNMLHGIDTYVMSDLPATTIRREYQLKKDILYNQSLLQEADNQQRTAINNKLFKLYQEEEKFYKNLKKMHPNYYNKKYDFKPLSILDIQERLNSDKELLWHSNFVEGKEYLFLISKRLSDVFVMSGNDYSEVLNQIDSKHIEKMIVIPDYKQKWINQEAIKYKGKYLIEKYDFIYNTSAYDYFNISGDKLINKKILAFAPVNFKSHKKETLHESEKEIRGIQKYFKLLSFSNEVATESNFRKNILKYGGIHISTHITYDSINPLKSKMYLTPEDEDDAGFLYAHDIFGIPMRTHLLTLSACDSRGGVYSDKIQIAGIADAFKYNGCRNIVLTLWNVEDTVIKDIMIAFYKYLSQGYPKERAIKMAKVDFIKNADRYKSSPEYWSAVILQGDMEKLGFAQSFWQRNFKLITIFILVFAFWLVRRRFSI